MRTDIRPIVAQKNPLLVRRGGGIIFCFLPPASNFLKRKLDKEFSKYS